MAATVLDVVIAALQEIGVLNAVDPPGAEDAQLGLSKFNRIIDNINAERAMIYFGALLPFPITPGLGAHSLGPTGVWVTPQRPVKIVAASWLDAATTIATPIDVYDLSWWQSVPDPNATADVPSALAYSPEWPNGNVFLYPIPLVANIVVMEIWGILTALTLTAPFTMPPGYEDMITLTLAEDLTGPMRVPVPPMLSGKARAARARIMALNDQTSRITTIDAGIPGGGGRGFDFRLGY